MLGLTVAFGLILVLLAIGAVRRKLESPKLVYERRNRPEWWYIHGGVDDRMCAQCGRRMSVRIHVGQDGRTRRVIYACAVCDYFETVHVED